MSLVNSDLREANLRGRTFYCSNLQLVNFQGADLREADLRGADLRGADLSDADLRGALYNDQTVFSSIPILSFFSFGLLGQFDTESRGMIYENIRITNFNNCGIPESRYARYPNAR